jgi:hypothetical protein
MRDESRWTHSSKKKKEDNFDVDRFLLKRGILLRFSELPSH